MIKQCDAYRDLECYVGPEGECKFKELEKWKDKIEDVRVEKGVFGYYSIFNANLDNLTCDYIPRIFHHFKDLTQLLVSNCGSMKINAETFKEATISKFIASDNNYPKIEDHTFSGAANLTKLYLKRNNIQEVSQLAFADCRKLRVVDLSANDVRELKAGSFNCSTLENLDLSRNKILQIQNGAFLGAENLTVLNLTHNQITGISDDGFKGLTNLRELRLGDNKLTQLRKEMLEKMENLNSLFVADNRIQILHADTFEGNRWLKDVYLEANQLKAVANGTFDVLQFKQLNLAGNPCVKDKSNIKDCIEEYNRLKLDRSTATTESTTSEHSEAIPTTKTREHRSFDENPLQAILTKFLLSKNYSIADFIFMQILLIFTWKLLSGHDETHDGNMRVNHTRRFSHLFLETAVSYDHHDDDDENNDQFPRDIQ
jgi:hypothetical protein